MRISEEAAIQMLVQGDVVAIPTETVYGLAASIAHSHAIEAIFSLKGRPRNNPLIVHLAPEKEPMAALSLYLEYVPTGLEKLIAAFWPGPLTLVLPIHPAAILPLARADLPTAAFRVPLHPVAQRILAQTGPLVAPSANRSGSPSSTCVEHVESDFGPAFPVVDGGICKEGVESTILIWHHDKWSVGRLGAIAPEDFVEILRYQPQWHHEQKVRGIGTDEGEGKEREIGQVSCPGQHYRHYAPRAQLILSEEDNAEGHAVVLGFSDRFYAGSKRQIFLSTSDDPNGCLKRLYHALRQLDKEQIPVAWVDLRIPQTGLWRTLRERLIRASGG